MTAGRGICHCEMPHGPDPGHGLQLWVNLPKNLKMIEPAYQELVDAQIPRTSKDGVEVKVIAGESMNVKSPVYTRTPTSYLDFKVNPGSSFTQQIPSDWNAFIFILQGSGLFGPVDKEVESNAHHTLILSKGDSIHFKNHKSELLNFVLIAGKPIGEPGIN